MFEYRVSEQPAMTKEKAPDEIFCQSCGEPIKEEAEICPECGVRNRAGQGGSYHDPEEYETTVSDSWYYAVIIGVVGWAAWVILTAVLPEREPGALEGLLLVSLWVLLPISFYFDGLYVRANSKWKPELVLWAVSGAIPLVNVVTGAVYLYRRHEVLGEP